SIGYIGSPISDLTAWKSVTGMDANSVSGDPIYAAGDDLHSEGAILNNVAQVFAGVTTDIDGDTRSATTPDIGADEYTPPPCPKVAAFVTVNIGATSGTFSFDDPSSNYDVEFGPHN